MAAYKFDKLATQTIEWTSSQGQALAITLSLVQEMTDYFGNGDWKPVRGGLNIKTTASIAGQDQGFCYLNKLTIVPGATHCVGRIALAPARAAEVQTALDALKAHPAWMAQKKAEARGLAECREYEAHVAAVNKMMMPGGSY